jgi:hypothetical protein
VEVGYIFRRPCRLGRDGDIDLGDVRGEEEATTAWRLLSGDCNDCTKLDSQCVSKRLDAWLDSRNHLLRELHWQAQKPYVAMPRLLFDQQKRRRAGSDAVLSHFRQSLCTVRWSES